MGAGDTERTGLRADRRQHPGPGQHGDAGGTGLVEFDVVRRDGTRRGDGIDTVHDGAVVPDRDRHARSTDTFEHRVLTQVGSGHVVAHLGEGDGDRAHARAADADDVQTPGGTEIEGGRIEGGRIEGGRSPTVGVAGSRLALQDGPSR